MKFNFRLICTKNSAKIYIEIVDDDEYTIIDNEVTEDEMEEGGYDNE